jgi:hypothetical protein
LRVSEELVGPRENAPFTNRGQCRRSVDAHVEVALRFTNYASSSHPNTRDGQAFADRVEGAGIHAGTRVGSERTSIPDEMLAAVRSSASRFFVSPERA